MSRGLEQAILLIEAVAEAGGGGVAQAELAKRLGTSEATVSRLVATWESHRYLVYHNFGVRLGPRAGELWRCYRRGLKLTIAEAEAGLRATALADEPPDRGPGQAENGGVE